MVDIQKEKQLKRKRRQKRVRAKISGTAELPRLNVYRSNIGVFVQLIDDVNGRTLVSASNKEVKAKGTKTEQSFEVGKLIAQKAQKAKIEKVVFDKGGFKYHGRIKAVAEGAREAGLQF
ncbi:MAG TPA: 50S ribosomal protein L18 [Patescibacteria group bacterium]|nr:50S ribosomal protein L18 [Patescibacteria group bacterium]